MMPDVPGIALREPIPAHDPETVCITITGFATVELAVEAMKRGAYDFIAKPFRADTLRMAVEKGLETRRLRRQNRRLQEAERRAERLSHEKELLEELERVKSSFVLTVAHELRAPIAAIQSYLTLILTGYSSVEEQRPMLKRALSRSEDLLALVDDLLNLARLKEVRQEAKIREVSLQESLEKVIDLHRAEAKGKQIALEVKVQPTPPALINPDHAQSLWTNLISNAVKYTPRGGRVTVRLYPEGDDTVVGQVRDTGIGIAEKDLPNLFKEFFRTDEAKAFARRGTGLGLSIVKQILDEYDGQIEVVSEPGQGTTFTFRLPAADRASASARPEVTPL
jgi:signal transduction histidine kinase